jgi:hypothetical protein
MCTSSGYTDGEAAIFDDLTALADATRSRMLLVLEAPRADGNGAVCHPATAAVHGHAPPQDAADAEWVSSRRDGTSRYYTLALDDRHGSDTLAVPGSPPRQVA